MVDIKITFILSNQFDLYSRCIDTIIHKPYFHHWKTSAFLLLKACGSSTLVYTSIHINLIKITNLELTYMREFAVCHQASNISFVKYCSVKDMSTIITVKSWRLGDEMWSFPWCYSNRAFGVDIGVIPLDNTREINWTWGIVDILAQFTWCILSELTAPHFFLCLKI